MKNPRMMELASEVLEKVQSRFPEIRLLRFRDNPESENSVLIEVTAPTSEEREFELSEFVSDIGSDILLDYGFMIFVLPRHHRAAAEQQEHQP